MGPNVNSSFDIFLSLCLSKTIAAFDLCRVASVFLCNGIICRHGQWHGQQHGQNGMGNSKGNGMGNSMDNGMAWCILFFKCHLL